MKIHIVTTGGTIDKVYFDAKSQFEVGDPTIANILREANVTIDFRVTALMRKDSLDLTDEDRQLMAGVVKSSECQHFLITHGTDTMLKTAEVLQSIPEKTIVLTGAMQPASLRYSDALFNIGFAIATVQTMPAGVYVAMNGKIFDPDKATKNVEGNRFETTD